MKRVVIVALLATIWFAWTPASASAGGFHADVYIGVPYVAPPVIYPYPYPYVGVYYGPRPYYGSYWYGGYRGSYYGGYRGHHHGGHGYKGGHYKGGHRGYGGHRGGYGGRHR